MYLFFLFCVLVFVYHNRREMNVLMTEIIRKTAGEDCGQGNKEIRPPQIVKLLDGTCNGNSYSSKQAKVHTLKEEEHYLHNSANVLL